MVIPDLEVITPTQPGVGDLEIAIELPSSSYMLVFRSQTAVGVTSGHKIASIYYKLKSSSSGWTKFTMPSATGLFYVGVDYAGTYLFRVECEDGYTNDNVMVGEINAFQTNKFNAINSNATNLKASCEGMTVETFIDAGYSNVKVTLEETVWSWYNGMWRYPNTTTILDEVSISYFDTLPNGECWFPIKDFEANSKKTRSSLFHITGSLRAGAVATSAYQVSVVDYIGDLTNSIAESIYYSQMFNPIASGEYYYAFTTQDYFSVKLAQHQFDNLTVINLMNSDGITRASWQDEYIWDGGTKTLSIPTEISRTKDANYIFKLRAYHASGCEFYNDDETSYIETDWFYASPGAVVPVTAIKFNDISVPIAYVKIDSKMYSKGKVEDENKIDTISYDVYDDFTKTRRRYDNVQLSTPYLRLVYGQCLYNTSKTYNSSITIVDVKSLDGYRVIGSIPMVVPIIQQDGDNHSTFTLYSKAMSGYKIKNDGQAKYVEDVFTRDTTKGEDVKIDSPNGTGTWLYDDAYFGTNGSKFKTSPLFNERFLTSYAGYDLISSATNNWNAWGCSRKSSLYKNEDVAPSLYINDDDTPAYTHYQSNYITKSPLQLIDSDRAKSFPIFKTGDLTAAKSRWSSSNVSSYAATTTSKFAAPSFNPHQLNTKAKYFWLLGANTLMPFSSSASYYSNMIYNTSFQESLTVTVEWDPTKKRTKVSSGASESTIVRDADGVFITAVAAGGGGGSPIVKIGGGGGGAGASATFYINARKHYEIYEQEVACKIVLGKRGHAGIESTDSNTPSISTYTNKDASDTTIKLYKDDDLNAEYIITLEGGKGGANGNSSDIPGLPGAGGRVLFKENGTSTNSSTILWDLYDGDIEGYYLIDARTNERTTADRMPNDIRKFFRLVCVSFGQTGGQGGNVDYTTIGASSHLSTIEAHMVPYKNEAPTATSQYEFSTLPDSRSWVNTHWLYPMFDMTANAGDTATFYHNMSGAGSNIYVTLASGSDAMNTTTHYCAYTSQRANLSKLFFGGCGGVSAIGCSVNSYDDRVLYTGSNVSWTMSLSGRTCGLGCGGRGGAQDTSLFVWPQASNEYKNLMLPDPGTPAGIWVYETYTPDQSK